MQIFISYAEADIGFAAELSQTLSQRGAKVWFARDHAPQDDAAAFEAAVQAALQHSDILITVQSEAAVDDAVLTQDWQSFIGNGRPVVTALVEDIQLPEELHRHGSTVEFTHGSVSSNLHRLQTVLLDLDSRLSTNKWRTPPSDDS